MSAIRWQSSVFVAVALATVAATPLLSAASSSALLIALLSLILLLGVPHGALDTMYASRQFHLRTPLHWLLFGLGYLAPALLVVVVWLLSPGLFLIGFLAISALHFSGDLANGTPWWVRTFYGAAVIVLPALFHAEELSRLFRFLAGPQTAALATSLLAALSPLWLAGLLVSVWFMRNRDPQTAVELLSIALLTVLAPPLVAFTVFFCGMHSARHILRSMQLSGAKSLRSMAVTASIPMLGTGIGVGLAFVLLPATSFEGRLIQTIFVVLAALTVPHMALVERVRFRGWRLSGASSGVA